MNVWIRFATLASALWLLGVAALVAYDFLNLRPGQCLFPGDVSNQVDRFNGWFLSCNMFSDLPGTWWGSTIIRRGTQIVELSTYRLFFAAAVPVAAIWLLITVLPSSLKWVFKGDRGGT